jgi:hypothetical protein
MKYEVEEDGIELGSVVNKESNSGITSNKRLLVLKGGCLYYYSTVPKAFKGIKGFTYRRLENSEISEG